MCNLDVCPSIYKEMIYTARPSAMSTISESRFGKEIGGSNSVRAIRLPTHITRTTTGW